MSQRRPGTPGTAKGLARRHALLDHAARILVEHGHAALTVRSVAAAAGISLGNLQYYFRTRADLVTALLDRHLSAASDRISAPLSAPADPHAAIDMLLAEQCDRDIAAVFYELWAMAAHDPAVAQAVRGFYDRYLTAVAELISTVAPNVPASTAHARARVFVGLLEGMSLLRSGLIADADGRSDALVRRLAGTLLTDNSRHDGET
ncbi:TetR family transcriptional regulator [Krasilnikovia cinnamomea]|uniref:TetR family transcriptional regulator n=1 Tax=Krasilnikovia cinnamomea TaxID=349313 RepID=A0A4Q7ZIU4_9ACTN|nr:TetR/AcrR family transcriptional regulator [Krasilnikovia cinnamomea]RZU50145.1 TetR family transcriptional regulator [Krasilnikovia cinnamomea]